MVLRRGAKARQFLGSERMVVGEFDLRLGVFAKLFLGISAFGQEMPEQSFSALTLGKCG